MAMYGNVPAIFGVGTLLLFVLSSLFLIPILPPWVLHGHLSANFSQSTDMVI